MFHKTTGGIFMFFDQLKKACSEHNTTPTAIVRKLGLSSGQVTAWKNGTIPKMNTVEMLAKELDVPVGFFFGSDDADQLLDDEAELLDIYRRLNKSGQRQLVGKAYEFLDAQNGSKTGDEAISPPNVDLVATLSDNRVKK